MNSAAEHTLDTGFYYLLTGCGKTRFAEYMVWRLMRPLIAISCQDDLSASDLVDATFV